MNQSSLTHLVSRLAVGVRKDPRKFCNPEGQLGRLKKMRKTVTALVRHERIELLYPRGDEARGYAERLISEAVRYGDQHKPTMEMAKFWIDDPALVPKLFKVFVPRYQNWPHGLPYTRMLRAPENSADLKKSWSSGGAILEFRGNPYPPLPGPTNRKNPGAIHNVLLEEARKDYFRTQSAIAKNAETLTSALPDADSSGMEPVDPADIDEARGKSMLTDRTQDSSSSDSSVRPQ